MRNGRCKWRLKSTSEDPSSRVQDEVLEFTNSGEIKLFQQGNHDRPMYLRYVAGNENEVVRFQSKGVAIVKKFDAATLS